MAVSTAPKRPAVSAGGLRKFTRYARANPMLVGGLVILLILLGIAAIGPMFVDTSQARPTSVPADRAPSAAYPLGSDDQGRNLLAVAVAGLPLTLEIGLIAGGVAIGVGTLLGILGGYAGGVVDVIIRGVSDVLLTVPALIVLVTIAASLKSLISVETTALIVASLAWMWPTRTIRAQVLTLRERPYVDVAKMSGMGMPGVVFRELMPNLLPYLAASFVTSTAAAILASVGLSALGLGPQSSPTLGMTIYWAIQFNAIVRGLWWWWLMPIILIVALFIALFLISAGLDELANPRARRSRRNA